MASKLEQKVRELDNEDERICQSAKRIAGALNKKVQAIHKIIIAKRHGFHDIASYYDYLSRKKGFKNFPEYRTFRAQTRGYINRNEYGLYCYQKKKGTFRDLRDFQEREGFNSDINYLSPFVLDNLPLDRDHSPSSFILEKGEENKKISLILGNIIKKLPSRYALIIQKRFYEGKSLRKVGEELNISGERIRQIETKALKKLYYLAKANGPYNIC